MWQAIEFGNQLLWGGNTSVQAVIFDSFVEMKRSFDSHAEEGFLRALQQRIKHLLAELLQERPPQEEGRGHLTHYSASNHTSATVIPKATADANGRRFATELRGASPEVGDKAAAAAAVA